MFLSLCLVCFPFRSSSARSPLIYLDTFASKVAAIQDKYADASVGNVTGSNAVNVFLGIGVAWTIGMYRFHTHFFSVFLPFPPPTPPPPHIPPPSLCLSASVWKTWDVSSNINRFTWIIENKKFVFMFQMTPNSTLMNNNFHELCQSERRLISSISLHFLLCDVSIRPIHLILGPSMLYRTPSIENTHKKKIRVLLFCLFSIHNSTIQKALSFIISAAVYHWYNGTQFLVEPGKWVYPQQFFFSLSLSAIIVRHRRRKQATNEWTSVCLFVEKPFGQLHSQTNLSLFLLVSYALKLSLSPIDAW